MTPLSFLYGASLRTAYRSPWQNPVAERWIGTLRRELLDHAVVLSQQHLIRLVRSYIRYCHEDRCHLELERDSPDRISGTPRPSPHAKVMAVYGREIMLSSRSAGERTRGAGQPGRAAKGAGSAESGPTSLVSSRATFSASTTAGVTRCLSSVGAPFTYSNASG